MFNFIDTTVDTIFSNPSVDPSSFKFDAKKAIGGNFCDEANFIANDLISKARMVIIEKLSIPKITNNNQDMLTSDSLNEFVTLSKYMADAFAKVEKVAAMVVAYEEWKDEVEVY